MRRSFVATIFALSLALAPAALFAQAAPPAQQPPAQPPAGQPAPAAPAQPVAAKVGFATPAGILLVQIKPDQTAVFEEMMTKLKAGLAASYGRRTQDADGRLQGLQVQGAVRRQCALRDHSSSRPSRTRSTSCSR